MNETDEKNINNDEFILGDAEKSSPRINNFIVNTTIVILSLSIAIAYIMFSREMSKVSNQIKAGSAKALEAERIKRYKEERANMSKQMDRKMRLRRLGIDISSEPTQKNDLLNAQLNAQQEQEDEKLKEATEQQQDQTFDYQAELAAYNAKLKEVQAEEAVIRAEAERLAAEKAERERVLKEKQEAYRKEQERNAQLRQEQEAARVKAEAEAAERERLAAERAAKLKAAQEKAAKAAAAKAKLEALKTSKKTLQTTQANFGSGGSFAQKQ